MPDIEQAAAQWIVVPDCAVTVTVDNGTAKPLGFDTPAQALVNLLNAKGIPAVAYGPTMSPSSEGRNEIRVITREFNGVSMAYAVEWKS
jgi:hypothetical protein